MLGMFTLCCGTQRWHIKRGEGLPDPHFHGYPISVASDSLNLAIVGVSNMALARSDRLLKQHHSHLPWFLATGKEGLYLGMHGIQFTAAGIGAELRNLATPNSIVQIPTNNDNQDFVSFGLQSTLKGLEMTVHLAYVVAIEYMTAGQGIWLNLKGKSDYGPASFACHPRGVQRNADCVRAEGERGSKHDRTDGRNCAASFVDELAARRIKRGALGVNLVVVRR